MKHTTRTLFLSALLALCGCSSPQDDNLKIISFNIRYNSVDNIDGENGWPNRKASVVRMINEEQPAAIGLQEALVDQLQYLDSCLPTYKRIGVGRDDGKEAGEFMAIYYDTMRLTLLSDTTRWLSMTPEVPSKYEGAGCYRTVTVARFRDRINGHEFAYLNTHLDHVSNDARVRGAQVIGDIVANRLKGIPVVVGGDMNCTAEYDEYKPFDFFYRAGLQEARELTDSTSHAITYNAFGKDASSVIDHFFVRDMQVLRFRTLDGDYGIPYISDHYPIAIDIRLQKSYFRQAR